MILVDTSGLLAALVASQRFHAEARGVLEAEDGPFVLSPFVLAELDYFLTGSVSIDAALDFLHDVESGAYDLTSFGTSDIAAARTIMDAYRDLAIGLADASLVVLAARYRTERVLTLDERHFRALRSPRGRPFELFPADG